MTSRRTLAVVLLATVLSTVGTSVGVAPQPAAAATPDATVLVAPDGGGILRSDRGLGVSVTVTNTGTTQLPRGRLSFSLDYGPVASTSTLISSITTPPEALQGQLAGAAAEISALGAGASDSVRATISRKDLSTLLSSASGARRLYVQYQPGTAPRRIAVSSVVKMASGAKASVGLGTVVPVLAPAGSTGVVDTTAQAQLTAPDGAWTQALRAAQAFPAATVALDPAVIASIRLAGTAAPPDAADFLDQLNRLGNETIRLPYADGDVTLERAAGLRTALTPSSFAGATPAPSDPGGATPAPTAPPTTPSATDLTDWNWSEQHIAWPVPHTAGGRDVAALGGSGGAVLLPSDDVVDTAARRATGPLATVRSSGSAKVLVADATTSSLLGKAAARGLPAQSALATLTGLLATAAVTRETPAMIATAGRSADSAGLERVLSLLGHQSWIHGESLSQLATGTATPVALRPHSVAPARVGAAETLLTAEHAVQELGKAITADRDTVTAPQRLALLGLLSAAWRSDDAGWRTATGAAGKTFDAVLAKVHLVKGSESNAIGTDGTLRVTVANELAVPVAVVVRASVNNGRLQFPDDRTSVIVPGGGSSSAKLAYRSITNGAAQVSLRLETKDGTTLDLGQRQFTVSAGFDAIIAVVLLTALGLLLALGVYRNVKRRRQPRTATA